MDMIELTIDGKAVKAKPGSTILEAALANGIYIPNLCYDRRLKPFGGCRMCLVEWEGSPKLFASCTTPIRKDMVIITESEKIAKARSFVLEMMLVHHPLDCPVCDKAGECSLQDLAYKYGPTMGKFKGERKHGPELLAAPLLERNPNRCILCGKCVRVCTEHQGVGAINFLNRGFEAIISPAFEETLDCEFCGQCIDACPVGALGSKPFRYRARVWYMQEKDAICPYCSVGCTLTLGIREGEVIRSIGLDGHGISKGDLCGRGRFGYDFLGSEKRLKTPLIKKGDDHVEATWDEALALIAKKLGEVAASGGGIGAIGSQRCTMEENYMLQKFMRSVVGSANIDSAARFGYAKAQQAIKKAFGVNTLPVDFDAPLSADAVLVVESDLTSTHPVFGLNAMSVGRKEGKRLIVIDPKVTKLARHCDDWLRNKPGTSVAVLNAMMNVIISEGLHAKSAQEVANFGALKTMVEAYTPEKAEELTGVVADRIVQAARDFASAKKKVVCMSLNDGENNKGSASVLAAANILMLVGEGADAFELPANFSNTLGMFEAGVRPDAGPSHGESTKGMDLVGMLYGDAPGVKALYIMGENPMVSFPDTSKVKSSLEALDFLVVQDIMMSDTAKMADVVLPAAAWVEKEGTLVGMTGQAQRNEKYVDAPGGALPDSEILVRLAKLIKPEAAPATYADLEKEAARKVNLDFDISKATKTFNPVEYVPSGEPTDAYPLSMVVGNLMQHSGSLSAMSKGLGSVVSDAYMQISEGDAQKYGIKDEEFVRIKSERGEVLLKAKVTDEVPDGMLFAPAHFSHAKVNALTHPSTNGTASIVPVKVEKA